MLLGSWGRHEVTSASDDDAIVIFCGARRDHVRPEPGQVAALLGGPAPGPEGLFGATAWLADLADNIGLDGDTNTILTRRMLFLLESVPIAGDQAYDAARDQLLATYLAAHERDFRPPRFLLNDLMRYWRTIAVDFEGKHRARAGEGWGLRHAKLRFSRKVLFAGGLLPVLECAGLPAADMPGFLAERLREPPLDRVARAFLDHGMADAGARALRAYAAFLDLLDDPERARAPRRAAPRPRRRRRSPTCACSRSATSCRERCWRCCSRTASSNSWCANTWCSKLRLAVARRFELSLLLLLLP